jgi:hypothetical protein
MQGYVRGNKVDFSSSSNITYAPVVIPGPSTNGFITGMVFRREVVG